MSAESTLGSLVAQMRNDGRSGDDIRAMIRAVYARDQEAFDKVYRPPDTPDTPGGFPGRGRRGVSVSQSLRDTDTESPHPLAGEGVSEPRYTSPVSERPFALPIREFIALDRPNAEPLLADMDGRAAVGRNSLTLLGARGGAGKTTFFVDLALHLAAGVDYPPWKVPKPVSVLIIENEGPEELFAEKLEQRLATFPHELQARLDIHTADWGGFSLAAGEHFLRLVGEISNYDLVFGDPLDSLGIEGVGSPEDTRRFLALMKATGLNKTVAWWLNTHPRKEKTTEALDEISGAWGGKPDSVFLLRMLDGDRTELRQPKLRWAKRGKGPTLLFDFDADTEAFTYLGEESEEERDYLAEIRELLSDGTWRTWKEIAATRESGGIGASGDTVKRLLELTRDEFESRTGEAAKEVGRHPSATVWQLRADPSFDPSFADIADANHRLTERTGQHKHTLEDAIAEVERMREEES